MLCDLFYQLGGCIGDCFDWYFGYYFGDGGVGQQYVFMFGLDQDVVDFVVVGVVYVFWFL